MKMENKFADLMLRWLSHLSKEKFRLKLPRFLDIFNEIISHQNVFLCLILESLSLGITLQALASQTTLYILILIKNYFISLKMSDVVSGETFLLMRINLTVLSSISSIRINEFVEF